MLSTLQPLIGLFGILGLAYALSTNRKAISLRVVGWGLGLQVLFALIVLKTDVGQAVFTVLGDKMRQLLEFSVVGSGFVFGALGAQSSALNVAGEHGQPGLTKFYFRDGADEERQNQARREERRAQFQEGARKFGQVFQIDTSAPAFSDRP